VFPEIKILVFRKACVIGTLGFSWLYYVARHMTFKIDIFIHNKFYFAGKKKILQIIHSQAPLILKKQSAFLL